MLAVGSMVETALLAAKILKGQGIQPAVVNARTVKPLDQEMMDRFLQDRCQLWVTLEDNVTEGGFGSSIDEYVMGYEARVKVVNMGIPDRFIAHGSVSELRKDLKLDPAGIAVRICSVLGREMTCEKSSERAY